MNTSIPTKFPGLSFFLLCPRIQQKLKKQGGSNKLKTWVLVKEKHYLLNKGSEQMNKAQLTLVINLQCVASVVNRDCYG